MSENPAMLTVTEAAERLGLSEPQVYRRIAAGQLRALRGTASRKARLLIEESSVEQFRASNGAFEIDTLPFLRPSDVAVLTGLTADRVRQLCVEGVFEYERREGPNGGYGHYRIPRASVEEWIKARADG